MKISLVGLGKSNFSLARRLCKKYEVFVSERRAFTKEELSFLKDCNISFENSHSEKVLKSDMIVMSPGISPLSPVGKMVKSSGKHVTCELAAFFELLKPSYGKTIAVTGTNGKTTTTMMIDHFLRKRGFRTCLCGNNEKPVSRLEGFADYIVLEISSFQLYWASNLKIDVGLILNIAPDHMDWHGSFENYKESKMKLAKLSKIIFFGEGIDAEPRYRMIKKEFLPVHLRTPQNTQNASGAAAVIEALGFDSSEFLESLFDFKTPPHRLEFVGKIGSVQFYNDSKATNTHAVMKAMENFDKVTLILSGIVKESDINHFIKILNDKAEAVVFLGESITKRIKGLSVPTFFADNMDDAVKKAYEVSSSTVLLSPAGASFDMYKNYEERGEDFKRSVLELIKDGT